MFKGLIDWVKGKANDVDDSMSANPTVIRERIRKTAADLKELTKDLSEQRAEQRQLSSEISEFEEKILHYQDGAKKALAAGDEMLAREALEEKKRVSVRLEQANKKLVIINQLIETMSVAEKNMERVKSDCELQLATLETSRELTEMAESATELASRYGTGSSINLGEVTRNQNVKLDAAMDRLSQVSEEKGVDSKLAQLGATDGIDAELQALKAEIEQK